MDKYTIFDQSGSALAVAPACESDPHADAARRDLEAALQLLTERAQYLTAASGASIALLEGRDLVCRAAAGRAAPELGAEIETGSGLLAESLHIGRLVRCDDADHDPRVNRESCRQLGVKSAIVMPLLRERQLLGVFELVADRPSAFEERDLAALMRLAEMALTAIEHADAAQRPLPEISGVENNQEPPEDPPAAVEPPTLTTAEEISSSSIEPLPSLAEEIAQIGSCRECGFPVSQGRALCVDCEQAGRPAESREDAAFSQLSAMGREESWFQAHSYTIGTLVIAALTIALLALKLR